MFLMLWYQRTDGVSRDGETFRSGVRTRSLLPRSAAPCWCPPAPQKLGRAPGLRAHPQMPTSLRTRRVGAKLGVAGCRRQGLRSVPAGRRQSRGTRIFSTESLLSWSSESPPSAHVVRGRGPAVPGRKSLVSGRTEVKE